MLIQPYLENAILHGINPKEGNGHIDISIKSS
jgi:sensor histidine kinase YesM